MQALCAVATRLKQHLEEKVAVGGSSEERLKRFSEALTSAQYAMKQFLCREPQEGVV